MMNRNVKNQIQAAFRKFLSDESQHNISLSGAGVIYQLEQRFIELVGHPYALTVANATSGLWAVFKALNIQDADVITTAYTWGGSLAGLILTGNRPVFADIDKDTLTLDPESVIKRITPKTKAILAVDIYGFPCDGTTLRKIADEHGLLLIQDCAQSLGAYISEVHTGWWADAEIFSMSCGKNLFAGEGGIIITNNEKLYNKLVWQTQHPYRQLRDIPFFPVNEIALNLRMHPLAAVWANATFKYALQAAESRWKNGCHVLKFLSDNKLSNTNLPDLTKIKPSFHKLTFEANEDRDKIKKTLDNRSYNCSLSLAPITKLIYEHDTYKKLSLENTWPKHNICPVAKQQCNKRLQLTFHNQ